MQHQDQLIYKQATAIPFPSPSKRSFSFLPSKALSSVFPSLASQVSIFKMRPNNPKRNWTPSYTILALCLLTFVIGITISMVGHFHLQNHPNGPHRKYHKAKVSGILIAVIAWAFTLSVFLVVLFLRMFNVYDASWFFSYESDPPPQPEEPPQEPEIHVPPAILGRIPPEFLQHKASDRLFRPPPQRNYPSMEELREWSLDPHTNGQPVQEIREGNRPEAVDPLQPRRIRWWDAGASSSRPPTDSIGAWDPRRVDDDASSSRPPIATTVAGDPRRVDNGASSSGPPGSMGIGSIDDVHSDKEPMSVESINAGLEEEEEEEGSDDVFRGPTPFRRVRSMNSIYAATQSTVIGRNNTIMGGEGRGLLMGPMPYRRSRSMNDLDAAREAMEVGRNNGRELIGSPF